MKRLRIIATLALCALLPATMAPTGGLPSRPTFQQVTAIGNFTGPSTAAVKVASALPAIDVKETDGAANNRLWRYVASGETLHLQAVDDAEGAAGEILTVERTGTTVDSIALNANLLLSQGSLDERFRMAAVNPFISFYDSGNTSRRAYLQWSAAGATSFSLVNEFSGGAINLTTTGNGAVNVKGLQYQRIERAVVNGTTGACSNASAGIACARTATGTYNVTFSPAFTSAPVCVATPGANLRTIVGSAPTVNQYLFNAWNSTAASLLDTEVQVMCAGYY